MKVNYFIAFDLGCHKWQDYTWKTGRGEVNLGRDNTFSKPDVAVERAFLLEHLFIV